jgi:AsmA family
MTEVEQERQRRRPRWLWLSLAVVVALVVVLVGPPLVSVSRYKSQITSLIARSLGRPVRLSSVHVRLLPRPGFVLYDLVVNDDPAYGAEPVIYASSVTAPIRIWPLWRGRLEISEISVDEASLNLVRTPDGLWNIDSLLETTASNAGRAGTDVHRAPFPRLEATNSRINFKNGIEKLPFSLIDADLSIWQSNPGEWRLRLRGQPARTDVSINSADTGIVEIEATAHQAADLRRMPIVLDMEWRDAQLGQLTRLMTGSDAGWRGDMRGDVHVEGTTDNAQIKARLRATGVHRAEFAPLQPMDFDANCSLVYHYTLRTVENLDCNSPLGDGRIRVTGEMTGAGHVPRYSVEMDRVPVGAGLEALRTVRSGVDPSLNAAGIVSGEVSYDETPAPTDGQLKNKKTSGHKKTHVAKSSAAAAGLLSGGFTVEGFQLSGGGLSQGLTVPKMVIAPTPAAQGHAQALAGTVAISAGTTVPLTLDLRLAFRSYLVMAHGEVGVKRAREFAHATRLSQAAVLDRLAGDPLTVELSAQGPWLPAEDLSMGEGEPTLAAAGIAGGIVSSAGAADAVDPVTDSLNGTVTVHNATWMADYLANPIEISSGTLHIFNSELRWDPVDFAYGPLKGIATLTVPRGCATPDTCPVQPHPNFNVRFGSVNAETVQTAILGAREKGTLLSDLLERLRPSAAPVWPQLKGTVIADSVIVGPVTLQNAKAELQIAPAGIEITALDAKLMGGAVHADGTLVTGDKPDYKLTAEFEKLNPVAVGQFLGEKWRGGTFDAQGKVELAGYTGSDLAGSAKGALHFEWRHGSAAGTGSPPELNRFDRWTADAETADGRVLLGQNELVRGSLKKALTVSVRLTEPVKLSFEAPDAAKADAAKANKAAPAKKAQIRGG